MKLIQLLHHDKELLMFWIQSKPNTGQVLMWIV